MGVFRLKGQPRRYSGIIIQVLQGQSIVWHDSRVQFSAYFPSLTHCSAVLEGVVRFYNGRGTAEQWIKEGKYALNWRCSAVVPSVRGQPGASVSVYSGVQPWELPSPVMPAQGGQALVAAERAGQADQDGRPSGAARAAIDLSVVRGVGSSTVVRGSVGSYRPVIAGAKLREGITTILPRGRALQGVGLSSMRFHPIGGGPKTTKMDKKHGSRQESHPLLDRPEIDWPCRTRISCHHLVWTAH